MDAAGNAFVGGYTASSNFPIQNATTAPSPWGEPSGYLAMLNDSGGQLFYSAYVRTGSGSTVQGVAVDQYGAAYVAYSAWDDVEANQLHDWSRVYAAKYTVSVR